MMYLAFESLFVDVIHVNEVIAEIQVVQMCEVLEGPRSDGADLVVS